ncbi:MULTISPECIES: Atxe2 family lasso peptide isopeptidase [Sphingobium]|jgi:dipeptidyl aminopeptidase/acylaminoacyl peptidase|uniref:Atxe2 family lasso peptide isopeptidase n=2 Tax=Sphingobium limneticum TaxID=1007511 RepID=A0A5J5HTW4_9SPHN|nr:MULTISPECIES: Atxe2 family lasso peptide isopeptidase [Sphingobium]KAA9011622.1 Atxe2 family lasso peptide isopeptidase [Sphingobium limneticum]KAA9012242.1 Atxe2 family lasso peptide isopeptidase [Sphingobium limneticum]KAA9024703.1 Atxe2 family lasso peptide isopeptidase [Sphingobium limneticum]
MLTWMLVAAAAGAAPASVDCRSALIPDHDMSLPQQIDAAVLMNLRDIGGLADMEPPFSVSPDGTKVAVALRRADADRNEYCQGFVIIDVRSRSVSDPIMVQGGVLLVRYDLANLTDYGGGVISTLVPRWSPDGRSLAYLERQNGIVQVMRHDIAGAIAVQVTHSPVDVRSVRWSDDGSELIYVSRPDELTAAQAVAQEGMNGYRFDMRWMPEWRSTPFPTLKPARTFAVALADGKSREIAHSDAFDSSPDIVATAEDLHGNTAHISYQSAHTINGPRQILASMHDGRQYACRDIRCAIARKIWWRDENSLIIASPAGWGGSMTSLSIWDLRGGTRRQMLVTSDLLTGCRATPAHFICAVESSKAPRRLVLIDYATGTQRDLFDPNPEWRAAKIGNVRRLHWRNDIGLECYGDLVLPVARDRPSRLPLVVVGYQSRGFLRGGTGDLFPVYPLAAKGMAVLVYNRPEHTGALAPAVDQAEVDRRGFADWSDKRSGASSIMTAISMLVDEGIADPERVGLTGFSDGVDKATYTFIHNKTFRAVSMGTCCSDTMGVNVTIGPYLSDVATTAGFPRLEDRSSERTREYSVSLNAEQIDVPILIQTADREYLQTLEVEATFRQAKKPLNLYVFPDEYHIFWQPAHRRASYLRNIAWFDYHLVKDGKGPVPDMLASSPETDR